MNKKHTDVIVVGFALFAMFFGAGNLIFPPYLGVIAGDNWTLAMLGFLVTGIGLPLMGIVAVATSGTSINDLADKVHPKFGPILGSVIMIIIGPLFAIPRTAATTFEIAMRPILPDANNLVFILIFFAITLYFAIKPASVVDNIGKILTPVLLVVLLIIIAKGVITPVGDMATIAEPAKFSRGFTEGYQTMDALGSVILAGIVINSIIAKGYTEKSQTVSMAIKAGVIAAAGLAVVYVGLMYVGAGMSSTFDGTVERTTLIITITETLLGGVGKYALGITVGLACLTTAIGLTSAAGDFFSGITKGKLSYKMVTIITVVMSAIIASMGVEKIIAFSVPILCLSYPVVIVLIVMSVTLGRVIKSRAPFAGAVFGAFAVSFVDFMIGMGAQSPILLSIQSSMPLASAGFGWIIPSVALAIIFAIFDKMRQKQTASDNA
ncbi:MAG: branched-chain amino acid transport system II carrier protein [Proteocatella sp.]